MCAALGARAWITCESRKFARHTPRRPERERERERKRAPAGRCESKHTGACAAISPSDAGPFRQHCWDWMGERVWQRIRHVCLGHRPNANIRQNETSRESAWHKLPSQLNRVLLFWTWASCCENAGEAKFDRCRMYAAGAWNCPHPVS